jgi:hypothetical protein
MSPPGQLVYDPMAVLVNLFADPQMAEDLAFAFTCQEVKAVMGVLEDQRRSDAAAHWLNHHLGDCDDPHRH